jgi:hypothetical protein
MKQKKPVPSRKEIYEQLMSLADTFERSAVKLDQHGTEKDKAFAAASRRVAAKYAARAQRMHCGPGPDED